MAFGRFQRVVGASGSIIDHRHDARRGIEGFEGLRGTERSVVQAAAEQGLAVGGMADFRYEADAPWRLPEQDALVVGYAASSDSAWAGALDALCSGMS
jgi:hypothetical protein